MCVCVQSLEQQLAAATVRESRLVAEAEQLAARLHEQEHVLADAKQREQALQQEIEHVMQQMLSPDVGVQLQQRQLELANVGEEPRGMRCCVRCCVRLSCGVSSSSSSSRCETSAHIASQPVSQCTHVVLVRPVADVVVVVPQALQREAEMKEQLSQLQSELQAAAASSAILHEDLKKVREGT